MGIDYLKRFYLKCNLCGYETYNDGNIRDDHGNEFQCVKPKCLGILEPTGESEYITELTERSD